MRPFILGSGGGVALALATTALSPMPTPERAGLQSTADETRMIQQGSRGCAAKPAVRHLPQALRHRAGSRPAFP